MYGEEQEARQMQTIEAGGLVFEAESRTLGADGGPALLVFGEVDGDRVQILRFDCFRDSPHYHYDPTGKNEVHQMENGLDSVAWTVDQVRTSVDKMIRTAGYEAVANQVDMSVVSEAADDIAQALRGS
jgi:hypothetical protein